MTIITKLTAKGFKSFANHTELIFGNNYNIIIGPNGSGKSCSYNTQVLLQNGELKPIGEIVENALKKSNLHIKLDDGVYTPENPEKVHTFGLKPNSMKVIKKNISAFIKRKGEPHLYTLITKTGKEVTTTACHPIMILKDSKIQSEVVGKLKTGDFIATPRKINLNIKKEIKFEKKKINKELARFVGYLTGDGYITKDRIELVNMDENVLNDFKNLAKKLFNLELKYEKKVGKATRLIYWNKNLPDFLKRLFRAKDKVTCLYKNIPPELLISNNQIIANFLGALFDCDASIRKDNPTFEFVTKNERLANQVQLSLLRFGIVARKKGKLKYATNTKNKTKRTYYHITIEGKEKLKLLYENIPLKCKHKKERLKKWAKLNIITNPNVDVIPKEANKLIKECQQVLCISYKPLRKKYPRLSAYNENRCCLTRKGINEALLIFNNKIKVFEKTKKNLKKDRNSLLNSIKSLGLKFNYCSKNIGLHKQGITIYWVHKKFNPKPKNAENLYNLIKKEINTRLKEAKETINILKNLANSDIFWDQIVEIKKVKGEPYVYDLKIPNCHNFIGNGIFVHNSNVMDALCFVLGKSSAKSMRAEKSANLIYNGGKKNRPAKEAKVSVHFDNSQKEFPVDDKEVRVTRIVRPNGNSIYKLNDQKMTRQQIVDTLSAARIDPDGHNVILQGDIVHFMEMKPEARREVIEEIAGISVYEDKKEKSLKELDKVQERLNSSGIILTERESNLKQLKKERDQAKRYKELQGRLKDNKATLINIEIKENEERRNKVLSEISKYDTNINVVNKRLLEIKNAIQEKRNEITNINIQLEEKGEKEQLLLRDEISTLKEDIAKYNARQETVQNEIEKIKARAIQLKTSLNETNTKISELTKNKKEITNEIEKIHSSENTILKELQIFKKKHKIENIGDFSTKIEEIEQKVDYVSNNIQELQEEKAELVREKDKATYHLDTIKVNLNKIKESKDSSKIEELKTKFENSVKELSKRLTDDSMLATQLHAARSKLVSENQNLAELKAKNLSQQAHLSNNQAIKKIIKDKQKGVYGLVSSLAEVPQEYSLAIEVAAGARANSIVVDNDVTAARLIQMLKQNRLGVVNFLPINKIKARKPQENIKSEGIKGLAHEVIKYDLKFKNIFSYVLGNTVIVDNIETARKIGIGRTRMVTLEGDLMEPSGAMIGGYRKKQGKFSEKEINIKIKELEQETTRLSKIITSLGEKRDQAEEKITNLRHEKAEYEGSIIKLEKSLGLEIDITQIEEEKIALENQQKEVTNDIKDVENKLKTNFNEITQLKKQSLIIRDKLMKDPTITSGLNTLNEKQNKIKEEILHKKSEITNIDNQVSMIKTESQRIDQILKSQGKENEDFKNELTNLIQLLIVKNKDLKQRQKKEVDFYGKFKDLATKRNKFSEDIQNKELGIDKENERIRQLELKKNELSIKKATIIAKIDGLNEEFEQFKDGKIRRGMNLDQLKTEIKEFETMVARLGSVNMRALEVYERLETEHKSLVEKQAKLKSEKEDVLSLIAEIDSKKAAVFMKTFRQLKSQFQEIFSLLTKKGEAFLEMENKEEPLEGGVEINVRLHGTHKYLDIRSLSGGEKTLAALAFIFAIQELQPASFYLLDEVDAALDKTNSEKLSQLINQYSSNAQYIVISHNDAIISEAHQVYGVSMQQGVSKIISLKI